MLTFEPFRIWFTKNHHSKRRMDFQDETRLHPTVAAKVWNDRFPVRSDTIEVICSTYGLRVEQVIEFKSNNGIN